MLILTVIQGPDQGRRFELPDNEPQLIGRSSEALPLTDRSISRRHAELTPDDGSWYIRDIKSSNGTFVNGRAVTGRRKLEPGDQIRAGSSLFVFGVEHSRPRKTGVRVARPGEMDSHVEFTSASNEDSMVLAVKNPSEAAVFQLKVVYELTQIIVSTASRQELFDRVMDLIFEYFKADRGFILLLEKEDDRPDPVVVRHRKKTSLRQQIHISKTIVQHVMRKREGVLSSNAMTDKRFAGGDSVQAYGIHSAMCVPIIYKDRLFGVISIDSQIANYTFTDDQLRLLTAIGVHLGLAMANAEMYDARLQQERLAATGQTVASVSHSIKNILQGMRGGADVVELGLRKDNMKVVKGGWEIVSRNLERIYGLTMNMLAFSKQRKPEIEMENLVKLLEEIVALVQNQFDYKKVALITDFDPNMPPVPIDANGIHQAVLNLLSNALDAVQPETGAVTISCSFDGDNQQFSIEVTDNGEGISPGQRKRLFQPFESNKGLKGTGLGLVVTKKIVDEHGGKISVESTEGKGTTFTLTLPFSEVIHSSPADTHGPGSEPEMKTPGEDDPLLR